jgi:hypothetical protein
MTFAEKFYDHYPKVALLNWPPGFYVLQAAWTLVFSPSRLSVLLLMAFLTCIVAVTVIRALLPEVGRGYAILGGAVFILIPLVQQYAGMVMTEIPVALFALWATLSFGRYLDRGWTRDSVLFGIFAAAAIMTKGSGGALAFVPPVAILLTGRINLLKRLNFWYPAVIVAVVSGPWTWLSRRVAMNGWQQDHLSVDYTWRAALSFGSAILLAAGLIISAFAVVGVAVTLIRIRKGQASGVWAAAIAQIFGVLAFHSLVPASLDKRHLIPALPAWSMCAVVGVVFISAQLASRSRMLRWAPYYVAVASLVFTAWMGPKKQAGGFGAVVAAEVQRQENSALFLVSSDATGEGMFVAETALNEKRPGHTIRRASKLLSTQRWDGGNYQIRVNNEAELLTLLEKERIRFVVLDASIPESLLAPHHRLLRSAVANTPDRFALRSTYTVTRDYLVKRPPLVLPHGISVYELQPKAVTAVAVASPTAKGSKRRPEGRKRPSDARRAALVEAAK